MITNGACKFCGQTAMTAAETEGEATYQATIACECPAAYNFKELKQKAADITVQMEQEYTTEHIADEVINMVRHSILQMTEDKLTKAQFVLPDGTKITAQRKGINIIIVRDKNNKSKIEV